MHNRLPAPSAKVIAKAKTHRVTPTPYGYLVKSGTSGKTYLVSMYGGCSCPLTRNEVFQECSHYMAVVAYANRVLRRARKRKK